MGDERGRWRKATHIVLEKNVAQLGDLGALRVVVRQQVRRWRRHDVSPRAHWSRLAWIRTCGADVESEQRRVVTCCSGVSGQVGVRVW